MPWYQTVTQWYFAYTMAVHIYTHTQKNLFFNVNLLQALVSFFVRTKNDCGSAMIQWWQYCSNLKCSLLLYWNSCFLWYLEDTSKNTMVLPWYMSIKYMILPLQFLVFSSSSEMQWSISTIIILSLYHNTNNLLFSEYHFKYHFFDMALVFSDIY